MSYYPHSATLAYRVLEYLKTQPSGKWFATRVLADALDQDRSSFPPCLEPCVRHGLLKLEKINGLNSYALGDGVPLPGPDDDDDDDLPVTPTVTSNTRWGDTPPAPKAKPKPKSKAKPKPEPVPMPVPEPDPAPQPKTQKRVMERYQGVTPEPIKPAPFEYGYSSTGVVSITKDGQTVALNPNEFGELHRFIDVVSAFHSGQELETEDV